MSNFKLNIITQSYPIIGKTELAPDTFLLRMAGKIQFKPGQFCQVDLPHVGEATFAYCSDPKEKKFFELCIRGCGSTSNAVTRLMPGEKMNIRGPYGNGWPTKELRRHNIILIAGGLGLVPLRPLIFEMLHERKNFGKITLIAGGKTSEHILFESDLITWKKKLDKVIAVAEYVEGDFWGAKGLITAPIEKLEIEAKKTMSLICGPEVMVPFVNNVLLDKGLAENQIYISYERRMECGIGVCQHCNIGKYLVCKDGPVFRYDLIKPELDK